MRKDRERLEDILEAASQIEKYAIEGKEKFNQAKTKTKGK